MTLNIYNKALYRQLRHLLIEKMIIVNEFTIHFFAQKVIAIYIYIC